jgi:hypothetical protein
MTAGYLRVGFALDDGNPRRSGIKIAGTGLPELSIG